MPENLRGRGTLKRGSEEHSVEFKRRGERSYRGLVEGGGGGVGLGGGGVWWARRKLNENKKRILHFRTKKKKTGGTCEFAIRGEWSGQGEDR